MRILWGSLRVRESRHLVSWWQTGTLMLGDATFLSGGGTEAAPSSTPACVATADIVTDAKGHILAQSSDRPVTRSETAMLIGCQRRVTQIGIFSRRCRVFFTPMLKQHFARER